MLEPFMQINIILNPLEFFVFFGLLVINCAIALVTICDAWIDYKEKKEAKKEKDDEATAG